MIAFLASLMGGGVASNFLLTWSNRGARRVLTEGRMALGRIPLMRPLISPSAADTDLLGGEEVGEGQRLLG